MPLLLRGEEAPRDGLRASSRSRASPAVELEPVGAYPGDSSVSRSPVECP